MHARVRGRRPGLSAMVLCTALVLAGEFLVFVGITGLQSYLPYNYEPYPFADATLALVMAFGAAIAWVGLFFLVGRRWGMATWMGAGLVSIPGGISLIIMACTASVAIPKGTAPGGLYCDAGLATVGFAWFVLGAGLFVSAVVRLRREKHG